MPAGSQCPQSTRILRRLMTIAARSPSAAPDYCQTSGRADNSSASRPSHLVVVEHDFRRRRPRLAGQHIAGLELPALERVVDGHRDLALDEAGAAGAAHAAAAGIGQL